MSQPTAPQSPAAPAEATEPAAAPSAAAPAAEPPKAPEPVDPRWEALAKKERDLSLQAKKLADARSALETERKEVEAAKGFRSGLKTNPAKVLQAELGEDWFTTLSRVKANGDAVTPELAVQVAREETESLRRELKEKELKAAQAEQERQLRAFREEGSRFAKAPERAEKYELINLLDEHAEIPRIIESHYERTCKRDETGNLAEHGEVLTYEQAADRLEKMLEERAEKARAAKKFQAKTGSPTTPAAPAAPAAPKREEPPHRRTLSNDMVAHTPPPAPPARTDEERRERAFAAWDKARANGAGAPH